MFVNASSVRYRLASVTSCKKEDLCAFWRLRPDRPRRVSGSSRNTSAYRSRDRSTATSAGIAEQRCEHNFEGVRSGRCQKRQEETPDTGGPEAHRRSGEAPLGEAEKGCGQQIASASKGWKSLPAPRVLLVLKSIRRAQCG